MESFSGGSVVKNHLKCRRCQNEGSVLGREDPLEEGMAAHFSILACRIP